MQSEIEQLRAELAQENQEITLIIESQENFLEFLEEKLAERPENEELVKEIIKEFKKIAI